MSFHLPSFTQPWLGLVCLCLSFNPLSGQEQTRPRETGLEPVVERMVASMGTMANLRIWGGDRTAALLASEAAVVALEQTEQRLSTWIEDSELSRINHSTPGTAVLLSDSTLWELHRVRNLVTQTQGSFDPGIGALIGAWDLRGEGRLPSREAIADLLLGASFTSLEFRGLSVVRLDARMLLDAGAFGKGAGLDYALEALLEQGVTRASVDLGGQVAFLPDQRGYEVGLADPRERGRIVLSLKLDGGSVATTGNSERGRSRDGVSIGHILDPRTGHPAHAGDPVLTASSVSVWCRSALDADAYATALFVLGPDQGLALARATKGLEALYLIPRPDDATGAGAEASPLEARSSDGLKDHLLMVASDLDITFTP